MRERVKEAKAPRATPRSDRQRATPLQPRSDAHYSPLTLRSLCPPSAAQRAGQQLLTCGPPPCTRGRLAGGKEGPVGLRRTADKHFALRLSSRLPLLLKCHLPERAARPLVPAADAAAASSAASNPIGAPSAATPQQQRSRGRGSRG
eukprot:scaffold34_cov271-Prasinococcus_capsulatus_cf.AAC.6